MRVTLRSKEHQIDQPSSLRKKEYNPIVLEEEEGLFDNSIERMITDVKMSIMESGLLSLDQKFNRWQKRH